MPCKETGEHGSLQDQKHKDSLKSPSHKGHTENALTLVFPLLNHEHKLWLLYDIQNVVGAQTW